MPTGAVDAAALAALDARYAARFAVGRDLALWPGRRRLLERTVGRTSGAWLAPRQRHPSPQELR